MPLPSARYHSVDALHAALRAAAAGSNGTLSLEWLPGEASQVERDDEGAPELLQLAVLRTAVPQASRRRLRALVVFGEHAREAITSEVALRLASVLAGGGDDAPLRRRAGSTRSR